MAECFITRRGGGTEVITGTLTVDYSATSVSIAAAVGKENIILLDNLTSGHPGANSTIFAYCLKGSTTPTIGYQDVNYYNTVVSGGSWDKSNGVLSVPYKLGCQNYRYIAW